jgi:hypothetical protein
MGLSRFIYESKGVGSKTFLHATAPRNGIDSGIYEIKSQNVSWADAACGISLCGSGLTACIKDGELVCVLDKKHWDVVAYKIINPFFSIKF